MDTIVDQTETQIAQLLAAERSVRGWSQGNLAERAGVSKAAIGKIERGEMSPSAVTLVKLASAFDLTLAGLLLKAEGEMPKLVRAATQPVWQDPETGYRRRQIFSRPDHPLELVQIELPAGKLLSYPAWTYDHIRQVIWMQSGQLTILEGTQRHQLAAGDCLAFGQPSEVTLSNESETACHYTIALARR